MDLKLRVSVVLAASLWLGAPNAPGQNASGSGYLKTKVDPGRTGVFVDGKYAGPAANFKIARKYAVSPGEHEIRLSEPRYEEVVRRVTIRANETTTLSEKMRALPLAKPPFGKLRILGFEKYSAVYVNGKYNGHSDEFDNFAQGLLLNPGEYTVRIEPPSGAPHEEKIKIEADRETIVKSK
jgi:hypothetical protein